MSVAKTAIRETQPLVRRANLLDVEAIARIHNQYVHAGPYTMEETAWTMLDVKRELNRFTDREGFLICEDSRGDVVGWSRVKHYSARAGYSIACEVSTYIDRGFRGAGTGNALLPAALELAERYGYRHAVAKIIAGNGPSLRFHLRHGFEVVGIQREIGIVDGQLADVVILQRIDPSVSTTAAA